MAAPAPYYDASAAFPYADAQDAGPVQGPAPPPPAPLAIPATTKKYSPYAPLVDQMTVHDPGVHFRIAQRMAEFAAMRVETFGPAAAYGGGAPPAYGGALTDAAATAPLVSAAAVEGGDAAYNGGDGGGLRWH